MTSKDIGINQCKMKYCFTQVEPTLPPGLVSRCNNGKLNFSAAGRKAYFITTFGAIQICRMEEEGGTTGTFLQGELALELSPGHFQGSPGQGQLL